MIFTTGSTLYVAVNHYIKNRLNKDAPGSDGIIFPPIPPKRGNGERSRWRETGTEEERKKGGRRKSVFHLHDTATGSLLDFRRAAAPVS